MCREGQFSNAACSRIVPETTSHSHGWTVFRTTMMSLPYILENVNYFSMKEFASYFGLCATIVGTPKAVLPFTHLDLATPKRRHSSYPLNHRSAIAHSLAKSFR